MVGNQPLNKIKLIQNSDQNVGTGLGLQYMQYMPILCNG